MARARFGTRFGARFGARFGMAAIIIASLITGSAVARPKQRKSRPPPTAVRPAEAPATAPSEAPEPRSGFGTAWGRMTVTPGGPVDMRPVPPTAGRDRCIGVNNIAGTQLFGDSAIELTMKNGQRYRMFFARECPALSFYQGFYYRRYKTGKLCAGRDSVGARSGGECPIASIIPVRRFSR